MPHLKRFIEKVKQPPSFLAVQYKAPDSVRAIIDMNGSGCGIFNTGDGYLLLNDGGDGKKVMKGDWVKKGLGGKLEIIKAMDFDGRYVEVML